MPAYHRLWFEDRQCIPQHPKELSHNVEEHPIETFHPEFGRRAECNLELFSEKCDFELKLVCDAKSLRITRGGI
jgi:hypothetical protein